jgi:hypothetical protein
MQKLFFNLSSIVGPIGLIVLLTNAAVDPANLLRGGTYVEGIALALTGGNNVDNIANYDERLLQKAYITYTRKPIDRVIMGSSRVMEIRQSFFPGEKVANLGVSHANINDLIAITGVLDSSHKLPKKVLIGVDPFLICRSKNGDSEWESLGAYHQYFIKKYHVKTKFQPTQTNTFKKYYTLATFDYFRQSLYFWSQGHDKKFINVGNQQPIKSGRLSDGSICYASDYKTPDTLVVSNVAAQSAKDKLPGIDQDKLQLLYVLINFYQRKQIEVSLVMVPFHYNYYTGINKHQQFNFQAYEKLFLDFAHRHKIKVMGSFNPIKEAVSKGEFYDLYHCTGESIQRIIQKHKL